MSVFLVECPACSCRIPVDSETMRRVEMPSTARILENTPDRCVIELSRCEHVGRPEPAGDADWTDPENAA